MCLSLLCLNPSGPILTTNMVGFKEILKACCGAGGGAYNYYQDATCGASVVVNGQLIQAEACSDQDPTFTGMASTLQTPQRAL